ncbi:MAG: hypothetical protein RMM53_05405, partial [Bacteroidia bacterium]|nr:hypothetical protein [Bacteroidia bacterium]
MILMAKSCELPRPKRPWDISETTERAGQVEVFLKEQLASIKSDEQTKTDPTAFGLKYGATGYVVARALSKISSPIVRRKDEDYRNENKSFY